MKHFVVGFAFTPEDYVLLIRKEQPAWQKGRVNGVGGKVEDGESASLAMVREFAEETGIATTEGDWRLVVVLTCPGGTVFFFRALFETKTLMPAHGKLNDVGEKLVLFRVSELPGAVIPNLRWLIPLALDTDVKLPVLVTERTEGGLTQ